MVKNMQPANYNGVMAFVWYKLLHKLLGVQSKYTYSNFGYDFWYKL